LSLTGFHFSRIREDIRKIVYMSGVGDGSDIALALSETALIRIQKCLQKFSAVCYSPRPALRRQREVGINAVRYNAKLVTRFTVTAWVWKQCVACIGIAYLSPTVHINRNALYVSKFKMIKCPELSIFVDILLHQISPSDRSCLSFFHVHVYGFVFAQCQFFI
jgi:hypothetical protein